MSGIYGSPGLGRCYLVLSILKSFYEVKAGLPEKNNHGYGIPTICAKPLGEQKVYDFWVYMPLSFGDRPFLVHCRILPILVPSQRRVFQ